MIKRGLIGALAIASLAATASLATADAGRKGAVCKPRGERGKLVCPRDALRGPRGPRGRPGEQGPPGPFQVADPAPWEEQRIDFIATAGTPPTEIASFAGGTLEASCDAGGTLSASATVTYGGSGMMQVTNIVERAHFSDANLDDGQVVDLLPGPGPDADGGSYELTQLGPNGIFVQGGTAKYAAFDGGGIAGGADCALIGTIKVS